jgi:hypothetical protein
MAASSTELLENTNLPSSNIILNFDENDDDLELVCLDVQLYDFDDDDCIGDILQSVSNRIRSFTDVETCLEYLTSNWYYRIFLIVSGRLAFSILTQAERMDQIISIFIF